MVGADAADESRLFHPVDDAGEAALAVEDPFRELFMRMPSGVSSRWTRTSYQRIGMPIACSSSRSSTSMSASALSKKRRQLRSRSGDGLDNVCSS